MQGKNRSEQIMALINERGFISVRDLSELCQVSEMTIRRDLSQLAEEKRIQRTYGGAAPIKQAPRDGEVEENRPSYRQDGLLVDRVDVLIATALNPKYDGVLLESLGSNKNLPIIAESLSIQNEYLSVQNESTVVAVDNYQAGLELGRWAGHYASEKWDQRATVLDLTYYLTNTLARSRGFISGVQEVVPTATVALSLDAQSRYDTAYQLTKDALTVFREINIIFAINDATAWGAINACKDLDANPGDIIVLPFGLEGNTLKEALLGGDFCQAGLAMFPEIVGPVCIEAAVAAYNHRMLSRQLVTPHVILTQDNLPDYYERIGLGWRLRWDTVKDRLSIPVEIGETRSRLEEKMPRRIGFMVPFSEHEWYQNLTASMKEYAGRLNIEFEIVDANQSLKDEVDFRRREIARLASDQIQPGDVVILDGGPIADYLAQELAQREKITIITNSVPVFDILRQNSSNNLISTGGAFRHSSQVFVGPTAEGALEGLRADKLFLMVTGVALNFGLSHTNISEVTMKQAMIRSAREVYLLADHTFFGQESMIQVAPLTVVDKLITDDALPASVRLDLTKLGIQILLAHT